MHDLELTITSRRGHKLATIQAGIDDGWSPITIFLHGFGSGKSNRMALAMMPRLVERGHTCCSFDFSGHGESGGKTADLTLASAADDLRDVIAHYAREQDAKRRFALVGNSFGASVGLRLYQDATIISRCFFRAPISDYAEVRRIQLGESRIAEWGRNGVTEIPSGAGTVRSGFCFYTEALGFDIYRHVADCSIPTLILQGTLDDNVPRTQTEALVLSMGDHAEARFVEGADHAFKSEHHAALLYDAGLAFLDGPDA